jgi:hypothetical protein
VENLAVILLLMLVIALLINYAHGGSRQVGAWLHAKYVGA